MTMVATYFITGLAILVAMVLLWLLSLVLKDASIVDIFWGPGFSIAVVLYFLLADSGQGNDTRKIITVVLALIWGVRLGGYIAWRNLRKGEEDFRYQAWRKQHGHRWWWYSFFQVFLLQGVLMWLISIPLLAAQYGNQNLTLIDGIAVLFWLAGMMFEAGGDYQMARFKANPANKGQVMNKGFWRYTRHPNYFGDAMVWWGFYLLALSAGGFGEWTIYAPLMMTFFLMKVSGVAMLERSMSKRPGYQAYMKSTPAFFPWFPKKQAEK